MDDSPYKVKVLNIDFPTSGKVKAFAHVSRDVSVSDTSTTGVSHISYPPDVILNEPNLSEKDDWMRYMLNEGEFLTGTEIDAPFDDGDMKYSSNGLEDRGELLDIPLYELISKKNADQLGPYDIDKTSILTQNLSAATEALNKMGPAFMLRELNVKSSSLSNYELNRVTNNPEFIGLLGSMSKTLTAYGIEPESNSEDVTELLLQGFDSTISDTQKAAVMSVFNKRYSVERALDDLVLVDQINPIPHPDYIIDDTTPGEANVFVSYENDVSSNGVDNEFIITPKKQEPFLVKVSGENIEVSQVMDSPKNEIDENLSPKFGR